LPPPLLLLHLLHQKVLVAGHPLSTVSFVGWQRGRGKKVVEKRDYTGHLPAGAKREWREILALFNVYRRCRIVDRQRHR